MPIVLVYGLILTATGKVMMIQQNLYRDRYEVSVKRIFDICQICVDLQLIYMSRMHWPFLIEFCVVFKR